jgi:zinc transport system ATP-binding protein
METKAKAGLQGVEPCALPHHGLEHAAPRGEPSAGVHREGSAAAPRRRKAADDTAGVLISGRSVTLQRGGRTILDHVDIDIRAGEIVTLIGPNGAGKTSLVRILLGLEVPDAGAVVRSSGLVVGYVPQRFERDAAIPMTVERFLTLGARVSAERVERGLDEVGATGLGARQLAHLSGGELQRVVLARALVREPGLLVLDEPARGVDHLGEADLYGLIGRLRDERGLGVLLVSHDLHVVMAQSDRVLCINRHVCCHGVPETVARHPEYVRLFGEAARAFAIYQHHHDHAHGLGGEPLPNCRHGDAPHA